MTLADKYSGGVIECPWCDAVTQHVDIDYRTHVEDFGCSKCGGRFNIEVEAIPEFAMFKVTPPTRRQEP